MKSSLTVSFLLGGLMLASAGAAKIMTPTIFIAQSLPALKLSTLIPTEIGGWIEEKSQVSSVVNPQSVQLIEKIYAQTLTRTYVNSDGDRIMLSIAYGTDQRDGMQVHQPEVCYPAQGFELLSKQRGVLNTAQGGIAVTRLATNLANQRYEPVTYWTTVGDRVVATGIDKKMIEMQYGLKGEIPDGLLFRVSSIDRDTAHAFLIQDSFVTALANDITQDDRKRLMGLR